MATQVQNRRGTTAEHSTFTGANGELTVDTDKDVVVVHDGSTAGGHPMLKQDGSNSALALGSAASPSLKWDANTGLYSPGADQVAISTNGTGRLFIDASGRVGVGDASPARDLEISSSAPIIRLTDSDGTDQYGEYGFSSGSLLIASRNNASNGPILFRGLGGGTTTEYARFSPDGRLGIGTASPAGLLHVGSGSTITPDANADDFVIDAGAADTGLSIISTTTGRIYFADAGDDEAGSIRYVHTDDSMRFETASTEKLRIDSSGRLLVGTSSARSNLSKNWAGAFTPDIQLERGGDISNTGLALINNSATGYASTLAFAQSRNSTIGGNGAVVNNAALGILSWQGNDGTNFLQAATIRAEVDGTPGANDMPGRLVLSTTSDGASSPTERMRIDSQGRVGIGVTTASARLHVDWAGGSQFRASNGSATFDILNDSTNSLLVSSGPMFYRTGTSGPHIFQKDGGSSEVARIDGSGRLLVGTSSGSSRLTVDNGQESVTGTGSREVGAARFIARRNGTPVVLRIEQQADGGGQSTINTGCSVGFFGYDGSAPQQLAEIAAIADGQSVASGDSPGRLVFSTTKDGQSSPTSWLELNNAGTLKAYDGSGTVPYYSRLIFSGVFGNYGGTSTFNISSVNGNATFLGALSKGSGSFKIPHPLPEKTDTHYLYHSFIEGPQADLIYRGHIQLVNGTASVNIDEAARMTEGTFEALCTNVCCFTSNESDWTAVRGSISGNILTIEAQDPTSTADVCWMVVGERKDQHMLDTDWTDENGRVITERLKSEVDALEAS